MATNKILIIRKVKHLTALYLILIFFFSSLIGVSSMKAADHGDSDFAASRGKKVKISGSLRYRLDLVQVNRHNGSQTIVEFDQRSRDPQIQLGLGVSGTRGVSGGLELGFDVNLAAGETSFKLNNNFTVYFTVTSKVGDLNVRIGGTWWESYLPFDLGGGTLLPLGYMNESPGRRFIIPRHIDRKFLILRSRI